MTDLDAKVRRPQKKITRVAPDPPPLIGSPMTRALLGFTDKQRDQLAEAEKSLKAKGKLPKGRKQIWERYQLCLDQEGRRGLLRAVPNKAVQELAGPGCTGGMLNVWEQAFGCPVSGKLIDLAAVFRWIRNDLADRTEDRQRAVSLDPDEDGTLFPGIGSPNLEEYRRWRAKMAELDVLERQGTLVALADVQLLLGQVAGILRSCGEQLQRHFGADALDMLTEALDEAEKVAEQHFNSMQQPGHNGRC